MVLRKLIAGNWKMHGLSGSLEEITPMMSKANDLAALCDMVVFPPATLIAAAAAMSREGALQVGAQDCHGEAYGAHTGEISAEMIADSGAQWVILGHSERRAGGESNAIVAQKLLAAVRAGLKAILCVGESAQTRRAGDAEAFVSAQLQASLKVAGRFTMPAAIAYEPVWAIGSNQPASLEEISQMHRYIRSVLDAMPGERKPSILYGGSVKPDNAAEILQIDHVDGVLVGGASLKAADFNAIAQACR
jgi:triosephosphate isomerase (TIM)